MNFISLYCYCMIPITLQMFKIEYYNDFLFFPRVISKDEYVKKKIFILTPTDGFLILFDKFKHIYKNNFKKYNSNFI